MHSCKIQNLRRKKKFRRNTVRGAGGLYEVLCLVFNLGRVTNALALWLGAEPAELLFYVFLPPLLLESAVRINFFMFKKVGVGYPCSHPGMHVAILTLTLHWVFPSILISAMNE